MFEDNNGSLEISKTPNMMPRTKHVAINYHYFRSYVGKGHLMLEKIDTAEQEAYFLATPLVEYFFRYLRKKVIGW